ncbi:MAG: tetratricopeptide repeat protein, partial [Chthonomonadales bacterium]
MPLRIASERPGVVWHGAFFARHSLALVNRELVLALMEDARFDIGILHHGAQAMDPGEDVRFARLAAASKILPQYSAVTVRHFWPPDFTPPVKGRFVLIQPWEFGALPKVWVDALAKSVDEIWVPSLFVREEYLNSGVPGDKVTVVPNGVNTQRFHPGVLPMALPTSKSYKFLFVGGTIARKGIDILLDAYVRAFTARDDVALVIKDFGTHSFYAGQGAAGLIAAVKALPNAPEIVYLTDDLSEADLPSLYAACDCLVHPYRGEGFGLPIAEAMACGKPVVVTRYGAALDYANENNAFLVPAKVVRLAEKRVGDLETVDYPYWAEPDREAVAATLRRIYENPEEAKQVGARAARDVAAKLTWKEAAAVAARRLDALVSWSPARVHRRIAHDASDYEERKQTALRCARAGNWRSALEGIEDCLAERPEDWDLVNARGVALFRLGRTDEARTTLEDGLRRAPLPRDFHHNLAFVFLETGQPLQALQHALAALRFTPDAPEIRRMVERSRQAVVKALRRLRKAGELPVHGSAHVRRDAKRKRRRLSASHSCPMGQGLAEMQELVTAADAALAGSGEASPVAKPRPRLSVVMIVKDEERYLQECLQSVKDAADEIVVVDTGSSDRTVEIAKDFGAKVVHHEWTDDFSAARNVSLDHATGDWALWIDADERLAPNQVGLLRTLIAEAEPNVGGYMVNIRNVMQMRSDPEVCWHRACRLFRNLPTVRFTGRVHEQNMQALQSAGYVCAMSQLVLDHVGYAAEVMTERNKHERFIRMLRREVEENRDPAYRTFHLFNLANAYYTAGDLHAAIAWFEQADENPDPTEEYTAMLYVEWATALYATGRAEDALRVCERAESLGIRHPAIEFAKGHAYLHREQYALAEEAFAKAIERGRTGLFAHTGDTGAYGYKAWYGLALAATGRDRYEEAAGHCRTALAEMADFHDARYLLAHCLRKLGKAREAVEELQRVVAKAPDHDAANLELSELLYDAREFAQAFPVLRRVAALHPDDAYAWFRLGYCCEQLGMLQEAADAYAAAARRAPASAEIRVNWGRVLGAAGEEADALERFAEAIRLDPAYANGYFSAADLLYRLGAYAEAISTLYAGLERDPHNAQGFLVLGNCYFRTGELAAAAAAYRQALSLQPNLAEAANNLQLAEERL